VKRLRRNGRVHLVSIVNRLADQSGVQRKIGPKNPSYAQPSTGAHTARRFAKMIALQSHAVGCSLRLPPEIA
jgi:hypothetical protein